MKILRNLLALVVSFMALLSTKAQTAEEVVNKWTNAMGGKEKLASMQTLYIENDVSIMNNAASSKSWLVNGKGSKTETDFSGQKIIDCYTVNNGWSINPLAGQPTATPMPASQIKMGQLQLEVAGPLFNYASKGSKVELMGKDNVNGASVYKLKLINSGGIEMNFFISDSSYYILKEVTKLNTDGQDVEINVVKSDYRKTEDGFVMPYSTEVSFPGLSVSLTSKKILVNQPVDPQIFEMPKN